MKYGRSEQLIRYFYISRKALYPPGCYKSTYVNRYSIIEMMREATEEEIEKYDLVEMGTGTENTPSIIRNIQRYDEKISKYKACETSIQSSEEKDS